VCVCVCVLHGSDLIRRERQMLLLLRVYVDNGEVLFLVYLISVRNELGSWKGT